MNEKRSGFASVRIWWLAIPGGVLLMSLLFSVIFTGGRFLHVSNIRNILLQSGSVLLMCSAVAIPFSRGYVDLSAFGIAAFAASLLGVFIDRLGIPAAAAILIVICISAALGLLNGLLAMLFRRKNVLFCAAGTLVTGLLYKYLPYMILGSNSIVLIQYFRGSSISVFFLFLLPVFLAVGIFALVSFTRGGKRAFNGVYEKNEDRNQGTILPFLLAGILSGIGAIVLSVRISTVRYGGISFNSSDFLIVALAGIAIPNAKKSKAGAFLGYLAIIPATIGSRILYYLGNFIGMDPYAINIILAVLTAAFLVLNGLFGARASKIISAPAAEPAPAAAEAVGDVQFSDLAQLIQLYEAGFITEDMFNQRKNELISRM